MVHTIAVMNAGLAIGQSMHFNTMAAVLAKIFVAALLNDHANTVFNGVTRDIKSARKKLKSSSARHGNLINLYGRREQGEPLSVEHQWCNEREVALEEWRSKKDPFQSQSMTPLLIALAPAFKDSKKKLPFYQEARTNSDDYAAALIRSLEAEAKGTSTSPSALVPNSNAHLALDMAMRAIVHKHKNPGRAKLQFQKEISRHLDMRMVHFVPYASVHIQQPQRTAVQHHPNWKGYLQLGGISSVAYDDVNGTPLDSDSIHRLARRNAQAITDEAQASDSRSPWSLRGFTPRDLPSLLDRRIAPQDWTLFMEKPAQKKSSWMSAAYREAYAKYDPADPAHQLGMLVGVIVGFQLPNQFYDREEIPDGITFEDDVELRKALRDKIGWCSRSVSKGSVDYPLWVISWMTAWILFHDKSSCAWGPDGQLVKEYTTGFST